MVHLFEATCRSQIPLYILGLLMRFGPHHGYLTGYWIGGLPVYQAGGPPLDFEKTG